MRACNRRRFLLAAAASAAAPTWVTHSARGQTLAAPSDRITVGVIGLGSRGYNLIDSLVNQRDAQIVALCDVDAHHHRDRPWGSGPGFGREPAEKKVATAYARQRKSGQARANLNVHADYRELLADDDLDAIVVATPDHWHAKITLDALQSGKDVYCEKPVTHLFREGQLVYRAAAEHKAVFQTGSQQRSDAKFRRAVELARGGFLGDLRRVEVGLPPGYDKPQGETTEKAPPNQLDYDFWCGPAPKLPYMRARHHRWWRGHRAFGGGVLMDWIGHHNDIAHWALDVDGSGPIHVEAVNWSFPNTDVYDTPFDYTIRCKYEGGVTSTISSRNRVGLKLIGEEGWVFVTRGRLEASDSRWIADGFETGVEVYRSDNHMRNFLDCVRKREPCIAPAATAHRSITPGHLGYVSQQVGRALTWDPREEVVMNDPEAQRLLQLVDYREPWNLSDVSLPESS